MKPLIDADVLRYEIGYAAETGWKAITQDEDAIPPFDYVEKILLERLAGIQAATKADEPAELYLTEGRTFRYDLAKKKPYKGTRVDKKPWHYHNLTVYLRDVLGAHVVTRIEADDELAIQHVNPNTETILVSRDKDLRQVPGPFYSWELGHQPEFGPVEIDKVGTLRRRSNGDLGGTGLLFFYSQVLTGDSVDNIPGAPGVGPVAAYKRIMGAYEDRESIGDVLDAVIDVYQDCYGHDYEAELLEQGRLCWMTRRLWPDGEPVLWEIGMEE